jgi:hypothetical protein
MFYINIILFKFLLFPINSFNDYTFISESIWIFYNFNTLILFNALSNDLKCSSVNYIYSKCNDLKLLSYFEIASKNIY